MTIARPTVRSRRWTSPTRLPRVVSLGLIVAGLAFGLNSVTYGHDTIWGHAIMGVACPGLGFAFAVLIWNRETGWTEGGPRSPLE